MSSVQRCDCQLVVCYAVLHLSVLPHVPKFLLALLSSSGLERVPNSWSKKTECAVPQNDNW